MNDFGIDFVPFNLPCGKQINREGQVNQCCKTECPNKNNDQIEECYDVNKYGHYRNIKPVLHNY
jgi:hypothetical protein